MSLDFQLEIKKLVFQYFVDLFTLRESNIKLHDPRSHYTFSIHSWRFWRLTCQTRQNRSGHNNSLEDCFGFYILSLSLYVYLFAILSFHILMYLFYTPFSPIPLKIYSLLRHANVLRAPEGCSCVNAFPCHVKKRHPKVDWKRSLCRISSLMNVFLCLVYTYLLHEYKQIKNKQTSKEWPIISILL